jgi:hypothetical protein
MPAPARAQALADFRDGRVQVLTNVGVLTEGFDDPGVSCVAMARPTRSEGMYAQCVGRGTRLYPGKTDCLILDFVDLSTLSLCTLPSLFGVPRDLDLRGQDANEARRIWQRIEFDHPGFELEAGALTLAEIQDRAAHFDPLTLRADVDVRAISGNAWFSLGRHGVGLHFETRPGTSREMLIVKHSGRGKVWEVLADGESKGRFSHLEEGVEAVDFEIERLGRHARLSALADASWRSIPVDEKGRAGVGAVTPAGQSSPRNRGEALQLAVWRRYHRPHARPD